MKTILKISAVSITLSAIAALCGCASEYYPNRYTTSYYNASPSYPVNYYPTVVYSKPYQIRYYYPNRYYAGNYYGTGYYSTNGYYNNGYYNNRYGAPYYYPLSVGRSCCTNGYNYQGF